MMGRPVRYIGIDRRGTARTGHVGVTDLCRWVEVKFEAGWRSLTVYTPSDASETLGGIGPDLDTGRRTWWAEK